MFNSQNIYITGLAVLIALAVIGGGVYFINKLFANDTQEVLVKFIVLVFTVLVGIFVVDKIIAFKIEILSEKEGDELFELIKTLVLMIFSYYFGSKKAVEK